MTYVRALAAAAAAAAAGGGSDGRRAARGGRWAVGGGRWTVKRAGQSAWTTAVVGQDISGHCTGPGWELELCRQHPGRGIEGYQSRSNVRVLYGPRLGGHSRARGVITTHTKPSRLRGHVVSNSLRELETNGRAVYSWTGENIELTVWAR